MIPKTSTLTQIKAVFRQFQFNLKEVANESLSSQLRDRAIFISPKDNHCDCGSVISSAKLPDSSEAVTDKEIGNLKKKGWSETKIKNHVASKLKIQNGMTRERDGEREKWSNLIKGLFSLTQMEMLGILTHQYDGDIFSEVITIKTRHKIRYTDFHTSQIDSFEYDEYYEIVNR